MIPFPIVLQPFDTDGTSRYQEFSFGLSENEITPIIHVRPRDECTFAWVPAKNGGGKIIIRGRCWAACQSKQSKINHPFAGLAGFSDVHKSEAIADCESNTNTQWRTRKHTHRKRVSAPVRSLLVLLPRLRCLFLKFLHRIKSMECKVAASFLFVFTAGALVEPHTR